MAITEEQRLILIERLKKAQAAKAAKKAARESAAAPAPAPPPVPVPAPAPAPVAPAKKPAKAKAVAPAPAPPPVPVPEPDPESETEVPEPTPVAPELYKPAVKASQPIDIPAPKAVAVKKAGKDKGYMKLKFYTQPTPKVLKKLMAIHDDTSSEEESEEEEPVSKPVSKPTHARFTPAAEEAKKQKMREMAEYYFNYY